METINAKTKRGKYFRTCYARSTKCELYEVYKKPSRTKITAYECCRILFDKEGGHNFKIISAGCQYFSVGWLTKEGLRVETAQNSYLIK